jgi:hypothetical protein
MRPIILIGFLFTVITSFAQTDTSYQLLWYAGKKIRPNVLLTQGGDTVTYDPSKRSIKVVSKNGDGKRLDNMLKELNKTPQRMNEMLTRLKGLPKPVLPFYANAIRSAFTEVKEDYNDVLSNVLTLPDTKFATTPPAGKGGDAGIDAWEEDVWEQAFKEFRQYIADHVNDDITNVPVPPRMEYGYCYACDEGKKSRYKKEMEEFIKKLRGEEDEKVLIKALGMIRQAEFLISDVEKYRKVRREFRLIADFILFRMSRRTTIVVDQYIDDPYRCRAVLEVALSAERQYQLMGFGEPLPKDYFARSLKALTGVLEKALREKDYPIALDLSFILSTERQAQLMGGFTTGDLFSRLIKFNQFKLTTNISAKISGDGGYSLAQAKGNNWFFAVPDSGCRLRWVLVGPNMNKLKEELVAAEIKGAGAEMKYVGTKEWNSDIPSIKINFCQDENIRDSIIHYPLHPEGFQELWQIPYAGVQNLTQVNGVLIGCFIDVERTKEDAAEYSDPKKVEQLQKAMQEKYEKFMKNYKEGDVKATDLSFPQLQAMANSQVNSMNMSELMHSINPGRYIFEPVVHNKEAIIVMDKLNGKNLFPENTATEYAWFHLTLEHDPDGPYAVLF